MIGSVSFSSGAVLSMTDVITSLLPAYNPQCLLASFGIYQHIPSMYSLAF